MDRHGARLDETQVLDASNIGPVVAQQRRNTGKFGVDGQNAAMSAVQLEAPDKELDEESASMSFNRKLGVGQEDADHGS